MRYRSGPRGISSHPLPPLFWAFSGFVYFIGTCMENFKFSSLIGQGPQLAPETGSVFPGQADNDSHEDIYYSS